MYRLLAVYQLIHYYILIDENFGETRVENIIKHYKQQTQQTTFESNSAVYQIYIHIYKYIYIYNYILLLFVCN